MYDKMYRTFVQELGPLLSEEASMTQEAPPRWSTFEAPSPALVVHVASENDVAEVVR